MFFFKKVAWKLEFDDHIVIVRSKKLSNHISNLPSLRTFLMSKKDDYENKGYNFKKIQEMNFRFITDLRYITYQHYILQPKSMLEWTVIKSLHGHPEATFYYTFNIHYTDRFFAVFEIIRIRNVLQQRENNQNVLFL